MSCRYFIKFVGALSLGKPAGNRTSYSRRQLCARARAITKACLVCLFVPFHSVLSASQVTLSTVFF